MTLRKPAAVSPERLKRIEKVLDDAIELIESLTQRDVACLEFLAYRGAREAGTVEIGEAIALRVPGGKSSHKAMGAATCGRLRSLGMVVHLGDVDAWRITRAGRYAVELSRIEQRAAVKPASAEE